jgi:hypothetical protein
VIASKHEIQSEATMGQNSLTKYAKISWGFQIAALVPHVHHILMSKEEQGVVGSSLA